MLKYETHKRSYNVSKHPFGKKQPKISNYVVFEKKRNLRAYLDRNDSGDPKIIRSYLFSERPVEDVVAEWSRTLETSSVLANHPTLLEYEMEQRDKIGPRSWMAPFSARQASVEEYYTASNVLFDPALQDAEVYREVFKRLQPIYGLRRSSYSKTWDNMKKSTSSGLPWWAKRRTLHFNEVAFQAHIFENFVKHHEPAVTYAGPMAVLGWRGQSGGPTIQDQKQRVVWMFPVHVNLAELTIYQPLIRALQRTNLHPALVSMEEVDKRITQLFDSKPSEQLVVVTDFKAFDQHFNPNMQCVAWTILSHIFAVDEKPDYAMLGIFNYKYYIPILCTQRVMYGGFHGMASGSGGTNMDENLAHMYLQHFTAHANGSTLNPNSIAYGDDGILTYAGITVEQVVSSYTKFGQEMNISKQYASTDDCTYLRRWHSTSYREDGIMVGVYPTMRALSSLLYQERYYDKDEWTRDMKLLRTLSILENCKYHPLFKEFVLYVMKGDKTNLGLHHPGFFCRISRVAERAIANNGEDFLGYTRSQQLEQDPSAGIEHWRVVSVLRQYAADNGIENFEGFKDTKKS